MRRASITVLLLTLMVPASAAGQDERGTSGAQSKTCLPERGLLVAETTRRALRDGSEVTERLSNGAYRVTRCDERERPRLSMTVLPLIDPDGGRRLVPGTVVRPDVIESYRFGDAKDRRWAAVWRRARAKVLARVIAATPGTARRDPAYAQEQARAGVAAAGACSDKQHAEHPGLWTDRRYSWRWNSASFGGHAATRKAFESARNAWDKSHTDCDLDDDTSIQAQFAGDTTLPAGTKDGVSVVDRKRLDVEGNCAGAIACTWVWRTGEGRYIETDTRFNSDIPWTNGNRDDAYDYRSVATHEFGHGIGLADLPSSPNLTMSFATRAGNTAPRTLGHGDILGLRELYGG